MKNTHFQCEYESMLTERESGKIVRMFDVLKETLGERPLVLYGAGELGGSILDVCEEQGLPVACVCDRRATGALGGVPIVDPQTLQRNFANATVVVCSYTYNDEIIKNLTRLGFAQDRIVPCPAEYSQYASPRSFGKHIDGYARAYDFFADNVSKRTVLGRLRMYLCETLMEINTACDRYYEDGFIELGKHEIFVDGGAYDGNSVISFIEKIKSLKGGYANIYAFEPDTENYAQAVKKTSQYPNISLIPKGLWNVETELEFFKNTAGSAGSSFVIGSSTTTAHVSVTSLDAFFKDKPDSELPTFIKLDIEGAEKEALIGATEIIRRVKPKLAICAYHKPEDVYELPQTIATIRSDYRFCLRQHSVDAFDTVLYAV